MTDKSTDTDDARDELERATNQMTTFLDYEHKQEARIALCTALIDYIHEDAAWYNAMNTAALRHRRVKFPAFQTLEYIDD